MSDASTYESSRVALAPVEQRTISFYGDELVAVRDSHDTVWVPVRRLCEAMGVTLRGQLAKIERSPIMREDLRSVYVTYTDGRTFAMECLPLKQVRFWLATLDASRVKEEVRDKVIQYQREVVEIIDRAFAPAAAAAADADEAQLVAMRDLALQQAELSRQQAQLWDRLLTERRRLNAVQQLAEDHEGILGDLERRIDDLHRELMQVQAGLNGRLAAMSDQIRLLPAPQEQQIGPVQKAAIKALVDDIVAAAQARGIRLGQGRNDYPAVWDAFKRRFDLAKYDELSLAQYEEGMAWLKAWLDRVYST